MRHLNTPLYIHRVYVFYIFFQQLFTLQKGERTLWVGSLITAGTAIPAARNARTNANVFSLTAIRTTANEMNTLRGANHTSHHDVHGTTFRTAVCVDNAREIYGFSEALRERPTQKRARLECSTKTCINTHTHTRARSINKHTQPHEHGEQHKTYTRTYIIDGRVAAMIARPAATEKWVCRLSRTCRVRHRVRTANREHSALTLTHFTLIQAAPPRMCCW